jgi:hypothetical protein
MSKFLEFLSLLQDEQLVIQQHKLPILVVTNDVPTNDNGKQNIKTSEHAFRHERNPINRIPVTIIACIDDHECIR